MRILTHLTANAQKLIPFDFKRESSMQSYILENSDVLSLDDTYCDVDVLGEEIHVPGARVSGDGRLDILVNYSNEFLGIVELKLEELNEKHLSQLEDYLSKKEDIFNLAHEEFELVAEDDEASGWIGVLVGSSIHSDLAKKISDGYTTRDTGIPVAALTIRRFRNESGSVYVVTDTFFKNLSSSKDRTKYSFLGETYGKGRLAHAIVEKYVLDNPNITFSQLERVFPKGLQGSAGVFDSVQRALEIENQTNPKRHFIKPDEQIELEDEKIAVSNQWGKGNINGLLKYVRENLGYNITETN